MSINESRARKVLDHLDRIKPTPQATAQDCQLRSILTNITGVKELGVLIQHHRQEKAISQVDLADLADISVGTLKNAEQGRNIGVVQMFAIFRALGVNIYA